MVGLMVAFHAASCGYFFCFRFPGVMEFPRDIYDDIRDIYILAGPPSCMQQAQPPNRHATFISCPGPWVITLLNDVYERLDRCRWWLLGQELTWTPWQVAQGGHQGARQQKWMMLPSSYPRSSIRHISRGIYRAAWSLSCIPGGAWMRIGRFASTTMRLASSLYSASFQSTLMRTGPWRRMWSAQIFSGGLPWHPGLDHLWTHLAISLRQKAIWSKMQQGSVVQASSAVRCCLESPHAHCDRCVHQVGSEVPSPLYNIKLLHCFLPGIWWCCGWAACMRTLTRSAGSRWTMWSSRETPSL